MRVVEVISQLSHTCVKASFSRGGKHLEQGISTGEKLRACVGQSAQAHSVIITDSVVTSRGFPVHRRNGNEKHGGFAE